MTEREISNPLGRKPDHPVDARLAVVPEYASRREMKDAGAYSRQPRNPSRERRAALTRSARTSLREHLGRGGVMLVIGGLFASLTIPAYANQDSLVLDEEAGPLAAQTLEFDPEASAHAPILRDGYGSTSAAELRRFYADAIRNQNMAAYVASGARELGDDYPWFAELTRYQGGGLSPLRYYYRECVDFVAWRLNRDAGSTGAPFLMDWGYLTPGAGSAYAWKSAWEAHGWPTGPTPEVGAVAWFPGANHVGYVGGILADGSVLIEEYNGPASHQYSQRIISADQAYYLYAPPRP